MAWSAEFVATLEHEKSSSGFLRIFSAKMSKVVRWLAVKVNDQVCVADSMQSRGTSIFFLKNGIFLRFSQKISKILRKSEKISENLKIFQKI